jgi:hypothetical protein
MGSEMSCPCSTNRNGIEVLVKKEASSSGITPNYFIDEDLKFDIDFRYENARIMVLEIENIEKLFKKSNNFLVPTNKDIQVLYN